jgi:hypothetical protein
VVARARRSKATVRPKPERKAKGSAKGAPKLAKKREKKTAAPPAKSKDTARKDPTETGDPEKRDRMYGGFTLRLHDHDRQGDKPAVYDQKLRPVIFAADAPGANRPAATSSGAPAAGAAASTPARPGGTPTTAPTVTTHLANDTTLVANLQSDLWTLGFWVFPRTSDGKPTLTGVFDWSTEWAVREFQIAAAMPNVAVQDVKKKPSDDECKTLGKYLSTLSAKKNDKVYTGAASGVVTPETAALIKHWLDGKNNYRCPLVVQVFRMKDPPEPDEGHKKKGKKPKGGKGPERQVNKVRDGIYAENIWRHDEVPHTSQQMVAWDFSGHYQPPSTCEDKGVVVGRYSIYSGYGGPSSYPEDGHCSPATQLSPSVVFGKEWKDLEDSEKSFFRAVAAVGSVECRGFLDSVNFYDNCHGSAGPFHWTMPKSDGSGGEYGGFMALLELKHPDAFKTCFSSLGLWGPRWNGSMAKDGRSLVSASNGTYGGYVYTRNTDGTFEQHPSKERPFANTYWLRSWQWAYRLEMAARTSADYRATMWEYACVRIREIRKLDQIHDWLPAECRPAGGARLTIGDVVTSAQGIAVLTRVHVRWSGALSAASKGKKGKAKPVLHDAIKAVLADTSLKDSDGEVLDWKGPPSEWNDLHQEALVDAIVHAVGTLAEPKQQQSVEGARYWPLAVANGRVLRRKEQRPVAAASATWIPAGADLEEYGPSCARNSFTASE